MKTKAHPRAAESSSSSSRPLTPKQQRFVAEYLIDLNATQAAIRAGYSAKTAEQQGPRLLGNVGVATAIAAGMRARSEQTGIDAKWVLRRLGEQAEADLADLYDEQGNLRHPKEWPEVWRKGLVAGVETVQERDGTGPGGEPIFATVRKVKLLDRTKLVELIGKHVQVSAFREQVGLSDPQGGPVQVATVKLDNIQKALARVRARQSG